MIETATGKELNKNNNVFRALLISGSRVRVPAEPQGRKALVAEAFRFILKFLKPVVIRQQLTETLTTKNNYNDNVAQWLLLQRS